MYYPNNTAIAATQFRREREEAGLPVATKRQVRQAMRIIDSSPTLRGHRTSLGIELMAISLPMTRTDRRLERRRLELELAAVKADDTKTDEQTAELAAPLEARIRSLRIEPRRVRTGDASEVTADKASAQAFVDANPHMDAVEAGEAVAHAFGYSGDLRKTTARATRFVNSLAARPRRVPGHIRQTLVMLSAMSQVIGLVQAREAIASA